jgi:hypothetical protein
VSFAIIAGCFLSVARNHFSEKKDYPADVSGPTTAIVAAFYAGVFALASSIVLAFEGTKSLQGTAAILFLAAAFSPVGGYVGRTPALILGLFLLGAVAPLIHEAVQY